MTPDSVIGLIGREWRGETEAQGFRARVPVCATKQKLSSDGPCSEFYSTAVVCTGVRAGSPIRG